MMLDSDQFEEYEAQHAMWQVSPFEIKSFYPLLQKYITDQYNQYAKERKGEPIGHTMDIVTGLSTAVGLYQYFANYLMEIDAKNIAESKDDCFLIEATLNDQQEIGKIIAAYGEESNLAEWLKVEGVSYHYHLAKGLTPDRLF